MSVPSSKSWLTEMISLPKLAALALAVAVGPLCAPPAALAAESAEGANLSYNMMGPSSCARWPRAAAIGSTAKVVPLNWALGFLSGSAKASNIARLEFIDPEAVSGWLDSYCRDHPTDSLPRAALAFEAELEARLNPPPPPPIMLPPPPPPAPKAAPRPRSRRAN